MITPMIHRLLTRGDLGRLVDEMARLDVAAGRSAELALEGGDVDAVLDSPLALGAVRRRRGAPAPVPPTPLRHIPIPPAPRPRRGARRRARGGRNGGAGRGAFGGGGPRRGPRGGGGGGTGGGAGGRAHGGPRRPSGPGRAPRGEPAPPVPQTAVLRAPPPLPPGSA